MLVLLAAVVTGAVAQTTYKVSVKEGTEDASNWQGKAGTGNYQSLPLEVVAANTAVSVKYSGTKKVKSVKAVKKAAATTTLDNTITAWTAGSYVVPSGGVTYSNAVTVSGDVTLTLTDGETLTLNKGISLASGATLTVEGNGNGTFTRRLACTLTMQINIQNLENGTWNCLIVDLDHDGKSDIVLNAYDYWQEKTYTYWLRSNGTRLIKQKESTSTRLDDAKAGHVFAGDFKGKGYLEIANFGYNCYYGVNADVNPSMHIYSSSSQNVSDGKVSYFSDSNGRKTYFNYASLATGNLYTKGSGSTYPMVDLAVPLTVTSQISESGASSISSRMDYTYSGLRAHMKGRGLLGFQGVTVSEYYSGKTVSTTTVLDNKSLMPSSVSTVTTQGGMTSTSISTMTLKQLATKN